MLSAKLPLGKRFENLVYAGDCVAGPVFLKLNIFSVDK